MMIKTNTNLGGGYIFKCLDKINGDSIIMIGWWTKEIWLLQDIIWVQRELRCDIFIAGGEKVRALGTETLTLLRLVEFCHADAHVLHSLALCYINLLKQTTLECSCSVKSYRAWGKHCFVLIPCRQLVSLMKGICFCEHDWNYNFYMHQHQVSLSEDIDCCQRWRNCKINSFSKCRVLQWQTGQSNFQLKLLFKAQHLLSFCDVPELVHLFTFNEYSLHSTFSDLVLI